MALVAEPPSAVDKNSIRDLRKAIPPPGRPGYDEL
jgi:hypothetical protein